MPYQITKTFRFEAAHRLLGHQGKCRHLHGHSYLAIVTLESETLDELDMVTDFGELDHLGNWIKLYLDHNIILSKDDPLACFEGGPVGVQREDLFGDKNPFICQGSPTAEHLAELLFRQASLLLCAGDVDFFVVSVTVFETDKCSATYSNRRM